MSQQGQPIPLHIQASPIQYQCPIQKPCEPCAMTYPAFVSWIVFMIIYYAFWGKKQQQQWVDKEVEKRLAAMRSISNSQPSKRVDKPTASQTRNQQVKPNPSLSRWGEGGGNFPPSSKPPTQSVTTSPQSSKPSFQPPPPPSPNPNLSKPPVSVPASVTPSSLQALSKAKQKVNLTQPANYATKDKLDRLTGSRDVSERLVANLKTKNPHQSEQWLYEKAIFDLERDRH